MRIDKHYNWQPAILADSADDLNGNDTQLKKVNGNDTQVKKVAANDIANKVNLLAMSTRDMDGTLGTRSTFANVWLRGGRR